MRYRKLSSDGDFSFGNGLLDFYIDEPDAPAQAVKTRLLLWLGEWFLDIEEGTKFMQGILGKYSQTVADNTIQQRILSTEGVTSIESYESTVNPETREMIVTCTINTVYGPSEIEVSNYAIY